MRPLALALLAALALVPQAEALQMSKKAIRNPGIFGIKIARTDMAFYGRADAILSISFQEFTTGAFIVSEVVIDMKDSHQQLRIYHTRPPGTDDVANRANRASEANSQNRGLDPSQASKLPIPSQLAAVESKVNNMITGTTGDIVVKLDRDGSYRAVMPGYVSAMPERYTVELRAPDAGERYVDAWGGILSAANDGAVPRFVIVDGPS